VGVGGLGVVVGGAWGGGGVFSWGWGGGFSSATGRSFPLSKILLRGLAHHHVPALRNSVLSESPLRAAGFK